ncbi:MULTISPECIES: hypothetical protein [Lactobacillus]|uniref:hypothetical protein n=1 Tax=Lactobacillus TaxID=1578 RepID=UPI0015E8CCB3|nr:MULTISPECIES: hypothetical protein [Lactobacillus]MBH9989786.1 hypothetical protein [Lactobacillus sp. M0392]MBI0024169.1 hypothetical protein [Lactobacillus sp. W8171]MBI0044827.1 hypothetical protein [Lactobacillus sp. M0393]
MSKKLYHQIAVALAIVSIVLAVGILIWGEKGTAFIAIIPAVIADLIERKVKKVK